VRRSLWFNFRTDLRDLRAESQHATNESRLPINRTGGGKVVGWVVAGQITGLGSLVIDVSSALDFIKVIYSTRWRICRGRPSPSESGLAKSSTCTLQDVTQSGLKVLGSCVGSMTPRAALPQAKIEEQERTLAKLPGLPHQNALLVLKECLQQNLRHLLRSLRSDDLSHLWARYDRSLQRCVLKMQGANLGPSGHGLDVPETMPETDLSTQLN
jgi:hypothetical protein